MRFSPPENPSRSSGWNETRHDYPTDVCLHNLIEAQVRRTANAAALVSNGQVFTSDGLTGAPTAWLIGPCRWGRPCLFYLLLDCVPLLHNQFGVKQLLVTGSSGLIGSEVVTFFCSENWEVYGLDNNMRKDFFGPQGDTLWNRDRLQKKFKTFRYREVDAGR